MTTSHANDHDVLDVLRTDHREATELITQIKASADAKQRRELTDQLIAELVRHSVAEEMYLYPVMREELPDGDQAVEHDVKEHQELEQQMKRLEDLDPADPTFEQAIEQLEETLADHIKDEEDEQFPKLRTHLPAERLVELKEKVDAAKSVAPTRPHPSAPHAELFHKTVGLGVGMVDRLRDKLSSRPT